MTDTSNETPEQAVKQLEKAVTQNQGVTRNPEGYQRERHLQSEPEFNAFEFKRKYVTYEEKERAVNRLMELFDSQKREYNKERQILCDNIVQFVANYEEYCGYVEPSVNFRLIKKGTSPLPTVNTVIETLPDPPSPFEIKGFQKVSDVDSVKSQLIQSLAMDSSELKNALNKVPKDYKYKDFEKSLLELAVGSDVVDITTGALRSISSVKGSSLSELTRAGAKGAFGVATDTECSDGQFVYVNGEKVCIPFRVVFDEDSMLDAMNQLVLSGTQDREREAYDKYVSLLAPKSRDDTLDPNIRRIRSKYTSQLDALYQSYVKDVVELYENISQGGGCNPSMIPVLNDVYLGFFDSLDDTVTDYERKNKQRLDEALYGKLTARQKTLNKTVTRYAGYRRGYSQDLRSENLCQMIRDIVSSVGDTLSDKYQVVPNKQTSEQACSQLIYDDQQGGGIYLDKGGRLEFSCYQVYRCISQAMRNLPDELKELRGYVSKKYQDIVQKFSQEKAEIIASEPQIKGFQELKPENSKFVDVMKLMGTSQAVQMMFYGDDTKIFPITHDFRPVSLVKHLKTLHEKDESVSDVWTPFIDYETLNQMIQSSDKFDSSTDIFSEDPTWVNYIRYVLPFYKLTGELLGIHRYDNESNPTLDRLDETEVPDSNSTTFWIKPHNVSNSFFWHMFHKHRVIQLSGKHSEMQRSMINNFLSFLEILRILESERIQRPGYGTESLPPKLKSFVDVAMKDVFQPLKVGLSDLFQRNEDTETPVLRCLQKVNLQQYMGALRDLKYSSVKSFSTLKDPSLRAIVEQKLNLTEENKILFAKAVDYLDEYLQQEKEDSSTDSSTDTPTDTSTDTSTDTPTDKPTDTTPLRPEEIDLKTQLDHEIRKEESLETQLQTDETQITQLTDENKELSEVSNEAVEKLQSEINDLTRKISVMRQRNKRLSKSLNKRSKKWVSEFDFANETILQQREEHKKQVEILERKKANKQQQMKLMRILVFELEKKHMIDLKHQEIKNQQIQDQMKKISDELKHIHQNEIQKQLIKETEKNKSQMNHLQKQLQSLQNENSMLRFQTTQAVSSPIPLTMSVQSKNRTQKKRPKKKRGSRHKKRKSIKKSKDMFTAFV